MRAKRNTYQKQTVLDVVRSLDCHPTIEAVYAAVKERDARISRSTVYRNLGVLAQNGDILLLDMPDACRVDFHTAQHYHLLCTLCGSVSDVPMPYAEELDRLAAATGARIESHFVRFKGVCAACSEKEEKNAAQQ